jgi:hypothetical protein
MRRASASVLKCCYGACNESTDIWQEEDLPRRQYEKQGMHVFIVETVVHLLSIYSGTEMHLTTPGFQEYLRLNTE